MTVFHKPNNKVALPILTKNGTQIDCSDNFNFLGIDLHKHMNWKSHVHIIAKRFLKLLAL